MKKSTEGVKRWEQTEKTPTKTRDDDTIPQSNTHQTFYEGWHQQRMTPRGCLNYLYTKKPPGRWIYRLFLLIVYTTTTTTTTTTITTTTTDQMNG
jgi:hypothetical protein